MIQSITDRFLAGLLRQFTTRDTFQTKFSRFHLIQSWYYRITLMFMSWRFVFKKYWTALWLSLLIASWSWARLLGRFPMSSSHWNTQDIFIILISIPKDHFPPTSFHVLAEFILKYSYEEFLHTTFIWCRHSMLITIIGRSRGRPGTHSPTDEIFLEVMESKYSVSIPRGYPLPHFASQTKEHPGFIPGPSLVNYPWFTGKANICFYYNWLVTRGITYLVWMVSY